MNIKRFLFFKSIFLYIINLKLKITLHTIIRKKKCLIHIQVRQAIHIMD